MKTDRASSLIFNESLQGKKQQQHMMLRLLCLFNCMQKYDENIFLLFSLTCLTIPLFSKDTRKDIKSSRPMKISPARRTNKKKKHKQTVVEWKIETRVVKLENIKEKKELFSRVCKLNNVLNAELVMFEGRKHAMIVVSRISLAPPTIIKVFALRD